MASPSISVVNASTDTSVANVDFGTVQANNDSVVVPVRIWNNRGGAAALSDFRDVSITSLDVDGGASSDIVAGKWVRINCPTVDGNASTWTQVGGSTVKFLRAVGVAAADGNIIKGTVNDGIANTIGSKVNYTEINIKVHVPLNAVPGSKAWKMRLTGYYV